MSTKSTIIKILYIQSHIIIIIIFHHLQEIFIPNEEDILLSDIEIYIKNILLRGKRCFTYIKIINVL